MPLTDIAVRAGKPSVAPFKLYDEPGLFLLVQPGGQRYWRFKYRLDGREKLLALGVYPDVSLALARERRDDARKLLASGGDPSAARQAEKLADANTFKAVALEWLGKQNFAPKTLKKAEWTFNDLLFRQLGAKPVRSITAPDVLAAVRRIETPARSRPRIGPSSGRARSSATPSPPAEPNAIQRPTFGARSRRSRSRIAPP